MGTKSKSGATSRPEFRPIPPGVTELTQFADGARIGTDGGIVELRDGRLMLAQGGGIVETGGKRPVVRISEDGGMSWSEAKPLACETGIGGLIRLHSGALGAYGFAGKTLNFILSKDEGETWRSIPIPVFPGFRPMFHSLVQLDSGRLLLVGYWETEKLNCFAPDLLPITDTRWGWWRGVPLFVEGHRWPEMEICKSYFSDDEGASWDECQGGLFGWFNEQGVPDGTGGITNVCEPTAAETNDGRVLLLARSKRGRLVQAYSLDEGQRWLSMQPTELASAPAPPMLVRIPTTGDLLCVWNQHSGAEIRRLLQRSRLSSAISKDGGATWDHFKTIELQAGMADIGRIIPDYPISANARGDLGPIQLDDGYSMFTYSNVDIVGQKVFLRYSRKWPEMVTADAPQPEIELTLASIWPSSTPKDRRADMRGEGVLRIYPLSWFYD